MCNKCENFHSKLFPNIQIFNSGKVLKELFTGLCKEEGHQNKLNYFCRTHNQLCCASYIAKIKKNEVKKHKDCNFCIIEEIIDEKKIK